MVVEMERYNLGIDETYSTHARQKDLTSGEVLWYSDHEKDNSWHTPGVALILSKEARGAQQVLNFTRSTKRGGNHCGKQLDRDYRNDNFNILKDSEP